MKADRIRERTTGITGIKVEKALWKKNSDFAAPQPTNSPTPLTRLSPYRGDKLSRLAPSSELIKWRPPCEIRSLAEGRRMAPILLR